MSETILWKKGSPGSFKPEQVEGAKAEGWKELEHEQQQPSDQQHQSGQSGEQRDGQEEHPKLADAGAGVSDHGVDEQPVGEHQPVRDEHGHGHAQPRGKRRG